MALFAEPAGSSGPWIAWEVSYGCPTIFLIFLGACTIALVRVVRAKKQEMEQGDEPDATSGQLNLHEWNPGQEEK